MVEFLFSHVWLLLMCDVSLCLLILFGAVTVLGEKDRYRVQFDDPRVCKSFLLGCCPHDILASTVSILYLFRSHAWKWVRNNEMCNLKKKKSNKKYSLVI